MNSTFIRYFCGAFVFLILLISSCNKEEPIPSYLYINKFSLSTDYPTQGSNSQKITDGWVYIDGLLLGVFELPATIPVLESGSHEIAIKPGIKNNGISSTRLAYTFYETYTTNIELTPELTNTIHPTTTYKSTAVIDWKEDFEGAAFSFVDTINTDTVMKATFVNVFEGNKSGIIHLDDVKNTYIGESANSYVLPKGGASVYLELDYKSNNTFGIGVYSANIVSPQSLLFITPSDEWNKIYIELTSLISNTSNSNPFRIYISMLKEPTVSNPELLIDNVKLVH